PHALAFEEIQPPHDRLEVLANHAYDLGTLFTVVAVVHGAHESVVRAQPRDHRGTLDDRVRAAPEVLPERDVDGHRLDAVDAYGASLRGTAPVCQGAAVMTFLTWWFAPAQYLGIGMDVITRSREQSQEQGVRPSTSAAGRVATLALLAVAAALRLWRLQQNGYDNGYYAAAVRSMAQSWHNFLYNSFDPACFASVAK